MCSGLAASAARGFIGPVGAYALRLQQMAMSDGKVDKSEKKRIDEESPHD